MPEGARLRIDPDDFGEIVGNLLDNARKYAKSSVRIWALTDDRDTCVVFEDDGEGLTPADRQHILQRGQRASTDSDGSGLGLFIVIESLAQYSLTLTLGASPTGGLRLSFPAPGWSVDLKLVRSAG